MLTWTCHVCGDERPDEKISVRKKKGYLGEVRVTENVRYCNDRMACDVGSFGVSFLKLSPEVEHD